MQALIFCGDRAASAKMKAVLNQFGLHCDAESPSASDLAGAVRRVQPNLSIVDLQTDRHGGLAAIKRLREAGAGVVIAVGSVEDPKFILNVLRDGADEYVDAAEMENDLTGILARLKARDLGDERGRLIAVLGASGGCGASTTAVNLAFTLATKDNPVALMDLCLYSGDHDLLVDVQPRYTVADLCDGYERIDESMLRQCFAVHDQHVHLLAAPRAIEDVGRIVPEGIRRTTDLVRAMYPNTVVEVDRMFGPEHQDALKQANHLLIVMRLDMVSLYQCRKLLDRLLRLGVASSRIRLVVNRHGQPKELPAAKAEQVLGKSIFHRLPDDPSRINAATNSGQPVVIGQPRSQVARSIRDLADQIRRQSGNEEEPSGRSAFWPARNIAAF